MPTAVGLPNVLIWAWYFWKKDVEDGYYMKDPDYYMRQQFQKLIDKLANILFPAATGVAFAANEEALTCNRRAGNLVGILQ